MVNFTENTETSFVLLPHPLDQPRKTKSIELFYRWQKPNRLWVRYYVETLLEELELPDYTEPNRADDLWQTTCFELFIKKQTDKKYVEFNFSPSTEWAAYEFSSYREGMTPFEMEKSPTIVLDVSDTYFTLEAEITLPSSFSSEPLQAGFSAVIAEQNSPKTYWALTHPCDKPDFHHEAGFAHKLKAADTL